MVMDVFWRLITSQMQLEDEKTARIIRWLEDDHKPNQTELAPASPVIKYFWLL